MDHVREIAIGYARDLLGQLTNPENDIKRLLALAKEIENYLRGWDDVKK